MRPVRLAGASASDGADSHAPGAAEMGVGQARSTGDADALVGEAHECDIP